MPNAEVRDRPRLQAEPGDFKTALDGFLRAGFRFDDAVALRIRPSCVAICGVPFMVSEFGGIGWAAEGGWGYGAGPKNLEEFYTRYEGLVDAQLDNPNLFGFCYTQLTDVEQEKNGLYYYDRRPKFDSQPPPRDHDAIRSVRTRNSGRRHHQVRILIPGRLSLAPCRMANSPPRGVMPSKPLSMTGQADNWMRRAG